MKALRIIGIVVAIISIVLIFIPKHGSKYKVNDKDVVFYEGDGVTEADAKKVGTYLTTNGYFGTDKEANVQIKADKDSKDMDVRFIVDKSKVTPAIEALFLTVGNDMAATTFPGKKLHVILTDTDFDDIKEVGVSTPAQQ